MKKFLNILPWIIGSLIVLSLLFIFVIGPILKSQTKKHSPEQHITHNQGDLELKVFYCSPSKKDRKIFGELVPYGEVWRTGANEASTFTTNKDLSIDGKTLAKGTYTLWTIPGETTWDLIFNSEMYDWGVKLTDQKPAREPKYDALVTTVTVSNSLTTTESFTISFSDIETATLMTLAWDNVVVPIILKEID